MYKLVWKKYVSTFIVKISPHAKCADIIITSLFSKILATPMTRGLKLKFQSKSSGDNSPEWQFQWVGKGVSWLPSPIEA